VLAQGAEKCGNAERERVAGAGLPPLLQRSRADDGEESEPAAAGSARLLVNQG